MCRGWVGPQEENADGAAEAWPAGLGYRLGGGHWLERGQDRRTEEEAITQRRNNITGVDRTTVARRQNKFHLFRSRCEVCSRSLLSVADVCTMHSIDKAAIL